MILNIDRNRVAETAAAPFSTAENGTPGEGRRRSGDDKVASLIEMG